MAEYLMKCRTCGNDVSSKVARCPHCGRRLKMALWLKIVIVIVVIIAISGIFSRKNRDSSDRYVSTNNEAVVDERSSEEIKNEFILTCEVYDYKEISRNPNNYISKPCKFNGKVIQVMESGLNVTLRVNITKDSYGLWEDTIYVDYKKANSDESRILDDDIITIYGIFNGIKTYTTALRTEMSIPWVMAKYVEID